MNPRFGALGATLFATILLTLPVSAASAPSTASGLGGGRLSITTDPGSLKDGHGHGDDTVLRWQWLKGTTWYVPLGTPLDGLLSAQCPDRGSGGGPDGYQINDYRDGYFWGKLVKSINGSPSCNSIIGSVTPEGWIHMTLVAQDLSNISRGMGSMRLKDGAWTMEWQGTFGPDIATQYTHWAYMTLTQPGLSELGQPA